MNIMKFYIWILYNIIYFKMIAYNNFKNHYNKTFLQQIHLMSQKPISIIIIVYHFLYFCWLKTYIFQMLLNMFESAEWNYSAKLYSICVISTSFCLRFLSFQIISKAQSMWHAACLSGLWTKYYLDILKIVFSILCVILPAIWE